MTRQCDRLIRQLLDAELIEARMYYVVSTNGFPSMQRYLQLTSKGATLLDEHTTLPLRYKSSRKDKGQDTVIHSLGINRFHVALQRGCWAEDIGLPFFIDDRQLAGLERSETLLENIPDAFFINASGDNRFTHCFEFDTGSETLKSDKGRTTDMHTKYTRYGDWIRNRFEVAPHFQGLPKPIVLVVTSGGEGRLRNLVETCYQSGGRGSYWFTTEARLYASKDASSFWGKVWDVPGGESCRSLLDRLK